MLIHVKLNDSNFTYGFGQVPGTRWQETSIIMDQVSVRKRIGYLGDNPSYLLTIRHICVTRSTNLSTQLRTVPVRKGPVIPEQNDKKSCRCSSLYQKLNITRNNPTITWIQFLDNAVRKKLLSWWCEVLKNGALCGLLHDKMTCK